MELRIPIEPGWLQINWGFEEAWGDMGRAISEQTSRTLLLSRDRSRPQQFAEELDFVSAFGWRSASALR
jgi:hypothetical protein